MLLASFNLSVYGNILIELSDMKIPFNYNISDHGEAVISRSRIIFFNVLTIVKIWKDIE